MAIKVQMRHKLNGLYRDGFVGFSWTYLFFGFFVPLFRGHYVLALYHFLIFLFLSPILLIVQPIIAFLFNRWYTRRLIEEGYYFDDEVELVKYAKQKIGVE
jgi:hypothetical protein